MNSFITGINKLLCVLLIMYHDVILNQLPGRVRQTVMHLLYDAEEDIVKDAGKKRRINAIIDYS